MNYMNTSGDDSSPSPTGSDCDKCILCLGSKGNLLASSELFRIRSCACAFHAHPACITSLYQHDPTRAQQCVMCSLPYPPPTSETLRAAHQASLLEIYARHRYPQHHVSHVFSLCASIAMLGLAAFFIYLIIVGHENSDKHIR